MAPATATVCAGCRNVAAALFHAAWSEPLGGFDWRAIYPGAVVLRDAAGRRVAVTAATEPFLRDSAHLVRFLEVRRAGEGFVEAVPKGFGAWALVVAVRSGAPVIWANVDQWYYRPDDPGDAARQMQGARPGWVVRHRPPVWGPEIIDLVVCRLSLRGEPLRLTGLARCLGEDPATGSFDAAAGPVRVHSSVASWLASECTGIMPLGAPAEQAALLRELTGGIVADDLAHGRALEKLMRRDVPAAPQIFIEKREAA